jgi:hypothetical protein
MAPFGRRALYPMPGATASARRMEGSEFNASVIGDDHRFVSRAGAVWACMRLARTEAQAQRSEMIRNCGGSRFCSSQAVDGEEDDEQREGR